MGRPASWRQKRVLITGANGFIGQHLVRRLAELEAQVYAGVSAAHESDFVGALGEPAQQALVFDVRDAEAVRKALHKVSPHIVFHLAATGVTDPAVDAMLALMVNTGGVVHLLEALKENDVERVVLAGTSHEYGAHGETRELDPFNAYAASKVAAWAFGRMYWHAHELPVVIVRPYQVYGPGQHAHTLIPAAMRAAISGDDFPMTPGEQERDFIFAADVVDGMMAAATADGIEGTSLDLGTGVGTTVRRVVEQIWKLTAAIGNIRPGARAYRTGAAMHLVADADRTAQLIGWRAKTPLEEGLRITMERLKSRCDKRYDI